MKNIAPSVTPALETHVDDFLEQPWRWKCVLERGKDKSCSLGRVMEMVFDANKEVTIEGHTQHHLEGP